MEFKNLKRKQLNSGEKKNQKKAFYQFRSDRLNISCQQDQNENNNYSVTEETN